jgi:hypothetical protein
MCFSRSGRDIQVRSLSISATTRAHRIGQKVAQIAQRPGGGDHDQTIEGVPVHGLGQMLGEIASELELGVAQGIGARLHGVAPLAGAIEGAPGAIARDLAALCRGAAELALGGRLELPALLRVLLDQPRPGAVRNQDPRSWHCSPPPGCSKNPVHTRTNGRH